MSRETWKKTPQQKVARAAARGTGCYLNPVECYDLGVMDDAVMLRAQIDDEAEQAWREQRKAERKKT